MEESLLPAGARTPNRPTFFNRFDLLVLSVTLLPAPAAGGVAGINLILRAAGADRLLKVSAGAWAAVFFGLALVVFLMTWGLRLRPHTGLLVLPLIMLGVLSVQLRDSERNNRPKIAFRFR